MDSVRFASNYRDITDVLKDSLWRSEEELLYSRAGQWSVGTAHSVLCYCCQQSAAAVWAGKAAQ